MKSALEKRLFRRELGDNTHYSSVAGIYGDKAWIDDMDIVNELGGHIGCVNALSWSTSGELLASGSDDQNLNIYSYQPDSSSAPFFLNTAIKTGHSANIFSVKFMPHSNDRTLISCAGDSEVRVFDIEYSGRASAPSEFATSVRSRRINNFFNGMRYLTEANTNARVYRSHADRVKRIVTESSPYLFLTCSEDGEVRQWDLRQPSSAYPLPRGGQGFMAYRPGLNHDDSNVPPALISYKRYHIDLNSISCSSSQPQYIALGGAHLHCFLHDRRMLRRDLLEERGQMGSLSPGPWSTDDDSMSQATRCVRRFAPNGQERFRARDNGHITACKISDANPNEIVVSWSGDHIYSFDIMRSPDAREAKQTEEPTIQENSSTSKTKKSKTRKRKRENAHPGSGASGNRYNLRRRSGGSQEDEDMSFRVRYGNGRSEDIPLNSLPGGIPDAPSELIERARESVLNEAQKLSLRIAKSLVEIRKLLFSVDASVRVAAETEITPYTTSFTSTLGYAATCLSEMDEVIRTWRYPLNPSHDDVIFQQALRRNRETSRRFVQASGTLARVLGGRLQTPSDSDGPQLELFRQIVPAPTENGMIDPSAQFGYDFLKAILLWLEGGREALLRGFKWNRTHRHNGDRFPIPEYAEEGSIETVLIPYLQNIAGDEAVVNVDASRFEHDSSRVLFGSQLAAVNAFAESIKLPLEDLTGSAAASITEEDGEHIENRPNLHALDRRASFRFWGLKVGRGILMEVGEGVNFEFVNRAFGGIRTTVEEEDEDDDQRERIQEDIDPDVEEEQIEEVRLISSAGRETSRRQRERDTPMSDHPTHGRESPVTGSLGHHETDGDSNDEDDSGGDDDDDADGAHDYLSDSEDDGGGSDSDDSGAFGGHSGRLFVRRGASRRTAVESHVPCSSHINVYRGHCNIKTVKDVNYFGLDDEYVVSGSDSGHVFIWDRKTSDLVNILEGDSDVVNVVQGHPYEPTLAVSGIDQTIKIFSPDIRAQHNARLGIDIADPDAQANIVSENHVGGNKGNQNRLHELGLKSRKRMHDSYQIMSQNDIDRQGGMNEAFITRGMLARLAATLRERQVIRGTIETTEGVEGGTITLDENCSQEVPLEMSTTQAKCDNHGKLISNKNAGLTLLKKREDATALLYADPHNPMRHIQRGMVHSELGYPDLAAADAYRALTLFEAVIDPDSSEYRARKRVGLDAVEPIVCPNVHDGENDCDDDEPENGNYDGDGDEDEGEDEKGFRPISQDEYTENIGHVYILLVKSLVQCGCMKDAYDFCLQAMDLSDSEFKSGRGMLDEQLAIIKRSFVDHQRSRRPKEKHEVSANEQNEETDDELLERFQPADLDAQGRARRVLYPWNTHEPDRNAPETLQLLNERLKKIAPKCEVRAVALPPLYHRTLDEKASGKKEGQEQEVSIQLGLVATQDIAPGETFLHESSLLTATNRLHDHLCDACNGPIPELSANNPSVGCQNCEDTIFCSKECHDLAQDVYHAIECGQEGLESIGKDIQDPKDKADYLYLLLLGRTIAMAATQKMHPLDLPEVKYIWGDFHPLDDGMIPPTAPSSPNSNNNHNRYYPRPSSATLPFSFHLSILQPTRFLEEMGLDPFTTIPLYDTWVLNTLYAKFRGTASGRLSTWDGGPEVCAVHPLWCLANHSCDPNVRWEWGGEITFTVRREDERVKWGGRKAGDGEWAGIKCGEEILNHYCDLDLGVRERREWAMGALGGVCRCERCVWEEEQVDTEEG
ncbi:hypothetical protein AJ78_06237 [Emergomyces pasteurianus Ep9510]|uniref:SET domain-containing protein n=1 Tax=Emergomyces pasteurianus Ep9510 TaxID=1447872 RepID=A0A1J9QAX1_9EURO|nr:hypothetical protein AJ78_06237 [Emergomyces pasteurianus Ep9510]